MEVMFGSRRRNGHFETVTLNKVAGFELRKNIQITNGKCVFVIKLLFINGNNI